MDLDLGRVRAFVAAATHRHLGDAGDDLAVSQQAVSKRILRLEQDLGEPLFTRVPQGVRLTDAGHRFLPHARELLAMAEAATRSARQEPTPLRVDVWGPFSGPVRLLADLARSHPEVELATTARWGLAGAVAALERREIDLAFGRIRGLTRRWPGDLSHRPARLETIAAAVCEGHSLAGAASLHPTDLRGSEVWWPVGDTPDEMVDYISRFAEEFGVPVVTRGNAVGALSPAEALLSSPGQVVLWGSQWLDAHAGVRAIPLEPAPVYPWSMVWRSGDRHPHLDLVRDACAGGGEMVFDPSRHWLPEADRAGR
jgi:DNA-binding transcriptional LysR family regulator